MPNPTEALKPCPAGHVDTRVVGGPGTAGGPKYWAGCVDCNWRAWGDTPEEAIDAWNSRLDQERERLRDLLRRVEPHLDAIVCYASTMGEHEPNRIAHDVRATLNSEVSHGRE